MFDFSFDTDWLLAAISMDEPLAKVPFAFIDSFTESASITQGPMTTWEALLMGLVKAVKRHGVPHNEGMARVLDEEIQSSADLDLLIHYLPPELANAGAGRSGSDVAGGCAGVDSTTQGGGRKLRSSDSTIRQVTINFLNVSSIVAAYLLSESLHATAAILCG